MKKNKLLASICFLLICLLTLSLTCYAEPDKSGSMVYTSGKQMDQIYELLQSDSYDLKKMLEVNSLTILKESITPVYTLNLSEYAQSKKMNVVPMWRSHSGLTSNGTGNVYVAKAVTLDKQFGGNIMFYIENGAAYNMMYSPSEYSPMWGASDDKYPASTSYADHASRISAALKEAEFVSVYDVKYVVIDSVGDFFYVSNDKHDRLFAAGYVSVNSSNKPIDNVDFSMEVTGELLNIANDWWAKEKTYSEEKAKWEAMHPGETWDMTGEVGVLPIITGCSQINNILDIASYLNIDYSLSSNQEINDKSVNDINVTANRVDTKVILGLVGVTAGVVLTICVIRRIRRQSRKSVKSPPHNAASKHP